MTRASYIFLAIVSALIAFETIGWPFEIRFAVPQFNYYAYAVLCFSLLIALLLVAMHGKRASIQVICLVLTLFVGAPAAFLGVFAAWEGNKVSEQGRDYSFEKIDEQKIGYATYRLYVADCGATCSHDLVLKKEIDIFVGVKLVSTIWTKLNEYEAVLSYKDNQIIISGVNGVLGEVAI